MQALKKKMADCSQLIISIYNSNGDEIASEQHFTASMLGSFSKDFHP